MSEGTTFQHPERLGPYHVLRVIGEGGMGVVYEAEQREPVRRRVAVKMMKTGMDTKEVVGRFEGERQALAVMEHPGIAKVLDAGASELGRPYFVMELVRGVPLDEFCDRRRFGLRERIRLFIKICEAVQHAHQKGVIHRDLKPGNILVSEEGDARPKIIDFGIAKATGQQLTPRTVVTTHGQALGTLAYMSPEQAEMGGLDIDTRTDVYSLGIVLYELLAGCVPLDPQSLGAPAFLAMLLERDGVVPTPVSQLTLLTGEQVQSLAARRGIEPAVLKRSLTGDLQWIVLKAIERDRSRRYDTAHGLALDLQRFLADEPVTARPPTARYRIGKFVRRNRVPVTAAGLLAVVLVLGLVGTSLGLVRARAAEALAAQQRATADRALDFMVGMFMETDPREGGRTDVTAREVLDAAVERLDSLDSEPVLQARLLQAMGATYTSLGSYERADSLLRRSLAVRREALGEGDGATEQSIRQLAWLYFNQGRVSDALPLMEESARIAEEVYDPGGPLYADVLQVLGMVRRELADYEGAREALDRSLEIREAYWGPDHAQTGWSLFHLAWLEVHLQDYDAAGTIYRRLLPIFTDAFGADDPITADVLSDYAAVLPDELGDSAQRIFERVLDIREQAFGAGHPLVASSWNNLGAAYVDLGATEDARASFQRSVDIYEAAGSTSGLDFARTLANLAGVQHALGEDDRAEATLQRGLGITVEAYGEAHPAVRAMNEQLADIYEATGRSAEAAAVRERLDALGGR